MSSHPNTYVAAVFTARGDFELPEDDIYIDNEAYCFVIEGNEAGITVEEHETFAVYEYITRGWEETVTLECLIRQVRDFSDKVSMYAMVNNLAYRIVIGANFC